MPAVLAAIVGSPQLVNAQQTVPQTAALQSCSINDGVCELNNYAGWFVGPAQDAKIVQFTASAIKPSVTTEQRIAADGRTKVVTFKGENGKYLAVQADKNWEVNFVATSPTDAAAQFVSVAGLDNPPGQTFTSFRSLSNPDRFLRHEGYKLFAHSNNNTSLFRRDASWRVLNAVEINEPDVLTGKKQPTPTPRPKPAPDLTKVGPFFPATHGDVHIRTGDGLTYDFQATGDYVLLRTLDDSVVIQSRQVADAKNPRVSINRAAAIKVGPDKVEVYSDPSHTVYVNGAVVTMPTVMMALPGGGSITPVQAKGTSGMIVHFPGSEFKARVLWYSNGSMDVERNFKLGNIKHEGLLGSNDGDPANDLQIRSGASVPKTPENIAKVGESWRVKAAESLFSRPGQAGGSVSATQPAMADLDPAARAQARQDCRAAGIADAYALRTCTYDVAATGDKTFIQSAQAVETAVRAIPAKDRAMESRDNAPAPAAPAKAAPASAASLMTNQQALGRGERLAMNGYYLTFQTDGNLCVYAQDGDRWQWCVNDAIGDKYQQVQRVSFVNGVLAVFDANNAKLWSTRPVADPYARLVLTPSGSLQTQSAVGAVYWTNK